MSIEIARRNTWSLSDANISGAEVSDATDEWIEELTGAAVESPTLSGFKHVADGAGVRLNSSQVESFTAAVLEIAPDVGGRQL